MPDCIRKDAAQKLDGPCRRRLATGYACPASRPGLFVDRGLSEPDVVENRLDVAQCHFLHEAMPDQGLDVAPDAPIVDFEGARFLRLAAVCDHAGSGIAQVVVRQCVNGACIRADLSSGSLHLQLGVESIGDLAQDFLCLVARLVQRQAAVLVNRLAELLASHGAPVLNKERLRAARLHAHAKPARVVVPEPDIAICTGFRRVDQPLGQSCHSGTPAGCGAPWGHPEGSNRRKYRQAISIGTLCGD